jgi:hypothetical protein
VSIEGLLGRCVLGILLGILKVAGTREGRVEVRAVLLMSLLGAVFASPVFAAGPLGSIHVGNWSGGAYTNDKTGAFSHCSAATGYANGVTLIVGQNAGGNWLLGFGSPAFNLTPPKRFPSMSRSMVRLSIISSALLCRLI